MRLFIFLLRYSRSLLAFAVLAGIISGASNTGLIILINKTINHQLSDKSILIFGFAALCLIVPVSRVLSESLLVRLTQRAIFDLRMQLTRHILNAPLRHLETLGAHRIMATLAEDVPIITHAASSIPLLCINIAIITGCLIYLAWLSWVIFLMVILLIAIGVAVYQMPVIRAVHYMRKAREEGDALFNHFRALTEGLKELKLHEQRGEAFVSEVLRSTAASFEKNNVIGMTIYTIAASVGQLLVFVAIGLILFAVPAVKEINLQVLVGYTLSFLFMMTPLQVSMNALPTLGRASVALKKVEDLGLSLESHSTEASHGLQTGPVISWQSLELMGVSHDYRNDGDGSEFSIGPMDLSFCPAETVFLIGGNGSGKTTFAKLLSGLYTPKSGEIRLNGEAITDETRCGYRQLFSAVFSDFYLFETLLGLDSEGLDAKAYYYLTQLQLSNKVQVKDGRFSTTDLSRGQRKRLALLTAYLEDRPFYIFDEWAADQDPVFKKVFYYELLPELKARGKTTLIISHDESYYHLADRIIKLDYGKVVQDSYPNSLPLSVGFE